MKLWLRRAIWAACLIGVSACAVIALRGPQGIPALLEKRREMRALMERNEELRRDLERRRDRIRKLNDSQAEQEMEIRKKLKLLKPGETTFILPEAPKDAAQPANPGRQDAPKEPPVAATPVPEQH
jgi:cell division protein FtsB